MPIQSSSIYHVVVPFPLLLATLAGGLTISSIGNNLSLVTSNANPPDNKLAGKILLLENAVAQSGVLFAFSAYFYDNRPTIFQVFRPLSTEGSQYRLISEFTVKPSIFRGYEDIYIESFLNRRCIGVQPGDRLAVYVTSDPLSIQTNFTASPLLITYTLPDPTKPLRINDTGTFDKVSLPYSLRTAAYIVSNGSTVASVDTDCILGTLIPRKSLPTTPTTTEMPITGAPGAPGQQGLPGQVGPTGATGAPGPLGPLGATGQRGSTGNTGPMGSMGVVGMTGAVGVRGLIGATGPLGASPSGATGATGLKGPPGPMGDNYTVYLNGPMNAGWMEEDPGEFWSQSRAIWSIYIWLAILSFVVLVVIVLLVVIYFVYKDVTAPDQTVAPARSISVLSPESPFKYSDTDVLHH